MSSTNRENVHHSSTEQQHPIAQEQPAHLTPEAVNEQLTELVAQSCKHSPGSIERHQGLNHLIQAIVKSSKLRWSGSLKHFDGESHATSEFRLIIRMHFRATLIAT